MTPADGRCQIPRDGTWAPGAAAIGSPSTRADRQIAWRGTVRSRAVRKIPVLTGPWAGRSFPRHAASFFQLVPAYLSSQPVPSNAGRPKPGPHLSFSPQSSLPRLSVSASAPAHRRPPSLAHRSCLARGPWTDSNCATLLFHSPQDFPPSFPCHVGSPTVCSEPSWRTIHPGRVSHYFIHLLRPLRTLGTLAPASIIHPSSCGGDRPAVTIS